MKTKLTNRASQVGRNMLGFAAPALVLGLVLVSQAQARINYPPGPVGTLQRGVDNILLKERADILRQNTLLAAQKQAVNRIGVLQQQLSQATDPAVIAALQRQIAQQQQRFNNLQGQINRNLVQLRRNLDVLNPQKDRALVLMNGFQSPRNQIVQFIRAASQQQNAYAVVMRAFLSRRPISPVFGF